jgi:hypothetical protein
MKLTSCRVCVAFTPRFLLLNLTKCFGWQPDFDWVPMFKPLSKRLNDRLAIAGQENVTIIEIA